MRKGDPTPKLNRWPEPGPWFPWRTDRIRFNGTERADGKPSISKALFPCREGDWFDVEYRRCDETCVRQAIARVNQNYLFLRTTFLSEEDCDPRIAWQFRVRQIGQDAKPEVEDLTDLLLTSG